MAFYDKAYRGIKSLISPATQRRNRMAETVVSPETQRRNRILPGGNFAAFPTEMARTGAAAMATKKATSDAMQRSMKTINRLIAEGKIPAADREMLLRKLLREIQENARLQAASRPVDSIELSKKALATILGGAAVAGGTAGVALDKMRDTGWGENAANFLLDYVSPLPRGMGFEGGPSKYQNQDMIPVGETEVMQSDYIEPYRGPQGIGSLRR